MRQTIGFGVAQDVGGHSPVMVTRSRSPRQRSTGRCLVEVVAVGQAESAHGRPGECFEDAPVREECRDVVARVVGRADLDHVHGHHAHLGAHAPHRPEHVGARQPARFRRAGTRGVRRVDGIHVDRNVEMVRSSRERFVDGPLQDRVEPVSLHLGHEVGVHLLLFHPGHHVGSGPVAAQADLHEVASEHGSTLDQAAHRGAVAGQHALHVRCGVRVGIEVDDADLSVAVDVGHGGGGRPGDAVVPAENDRDAHRLRGSRPRSSGCSRRCDRCSRSPPRHRRSHRP